MLRPLFPVALLILLTVVPTVAKTPTVTVDDPIPSNAMDVSTWGDDCVQPSAGIAMDPDGHFVTMRRDECSVAR